MTWAARTDDLLEAIPPYFHGDPPTRQVLNAFGAELERVEEATAMVVAGLFPQTADDTYGLLSLWEHLLRLPVAPEYLDTEQRQDRAVARWRARNGGTGADWIAAVTEAIGSGDWEHEEHQPEDYKVTIWVPWPLESQRLEDAEAAVKVVTPAHLEVIVESREAFNVDIDKVDEDKI